jgi:MarR family 2-MHQ and catechol resistance regulon transcriptional repressor
MPEKIKDDFNYLIKLMFATGRIIRKRTEKKERPNPFSILQLETLAYIKEEKPVMKEVADFLCITPPSATSLINKLVKAGMLERFFNKDDRRIVHLAITAKGEKMLRQEFNKVARHIRKILIKLNNQERKNLIRILEKLQRIYQQS